MPARSTFLPAVAIVLVALAVRLGAGCWWQARLPADQPFFFGDSASYWRLGQSLAQGQPYEYDGPETRVFRAPGYPLLLAGMFRWFGADAPVSYGRALGAICGAAAVATIIAWATWLFDQRAGLAAGLIAALYPGAVALSVFVLSEAAFCPLMVGQLWLWGVATRSPQPRRGLWCAAGAGVLAGCATLVRPSWLLFTPLACLLAVVFGRNRRRHLTTGCVLVAGLALVMAPWWIRNARVVGHFVPTTLQVGASLYDGLNQRATGASDMRFVPDFTAELRAADARAAEPASDPFEYRLDRYLSAAALDWAAAHPLRVVELAGLKLVRLWNVWPNESEFRSWPLRLVTAGTYLPLLLAGLYGAWRYRHAGWAYALPCLPAVYFTLLHTIFVSSLRYREPAMLALIVLAAGAVAAVDKPLPHSPAGGSAVAGTNA